MSHLNRIARFAIGRTVRTGSTAPLSASHIGEPPQQPASGAIIHVPCATWRASQRLLGHGSRRHLSAFSSAPPPTEDPLGSALLDLVTYEAVCADTLESLCEYFDHLVETSPHLKYADITFSDGVLTVQFGSSHGTYVINRQSPNRQIWLSSPTSGPKRYDFVPAATTTPTSQTTADEAAANLQRGTWVYKHDGVTLHALLQSEIAAIVRGKVDFLGLPFGRLE